MSGQIPTHPAQTMHLLLSKSSSIFGFEVAGIILGNLEKTGQGLTPFKVSSKEIARKASLLSRHCGWATKRSNC